MKINKIGGSHDSLHSKLHYFNLLLLVRFPSQFLDAKLIFDQNIKICFSL